jgi:hypothetical protein
MFNLAQRLPSRTLNSRPLMPWGCEVSLACNLPRSGGNVHASVTLLDVLSARHGKSALGSRARGAFHGLFTKLASDFGRLLRV